MQQAVPCIGPLEIPVREVRQITAGLQGAADDEHAEQKHHHVSVDRQEGVAGGDGAGKEDGGRAGGHDEPDLQAHLADLADGDQQKDQSEDYNRKRHEESEERIVNGQQERGLFEGLPTDT